MIDASGQRYLNIVATNPYPGMTNISATTDIKVEFSLDLDRSSIYGNIHVLKDVNDKFRGMGAVMDLNDYEIVRCNLYCADKVVTIKPINPLEINVKYIVYVSTNVMDILSGSLATPYVTYFVTQSEVGSSPVVLKEPADMAILKPKGVLLKWVCADPTGPFTVDVSKSRDFAALSATAIVMEDQCSIPEAMAEGLYFWRVRPLNGAVSEAWQFFIKNEVSAPVSVEDIVETDVVEEMFDESVEILETFPQEGFSGAGVNVKTFYIKMAGIVPLSHIDLSDCYVEGELNDPDDEGVVEGHGEVAGTWSVIQDSEEDATYLIFSPESL